MRLYDSRKRILVTGGAGFVGSHPYDRLQRCPDIMRARNLLNREPTIPLTEGLVPTIAYFRELLAEHEAMAG